MSYYLLHFSDWVTFRLILIVITVGFLFSVADDVRKVRAAHQGRAARRDLSRAAAGAKARYDWRAMLAPASDQIQSYLLPQSVIPRGLAYIIDTAVVAALLAVLMVAGVLQDQRLESLDPEAIREMLESNAGLSVYVILFAYFLVCEGAWGRTVGKVALGLRVVRVLDGKPCGWSRSIVRNLIRPFDLFFLGLPGAVVVLVTPARQRIGDLLGGTLVVREVKFPPAMITVTPGLLRRCEACGRLAPATGPCPGCAAPAPAAGAAFGEQMLQPLAGMMAVGEAAAALRLAAQDVLTAESAYGAASAVESARLGRAAAAAAAESQAVGEVTEGTPAPVEAVTAEPASDEPHPPVTLDDPSVMAPAADSFVHTDDVPDMSADYIAAWRGLMASVETLRERRSDLDGALVAAHVTLEQVTASDTALRRLLEQVTPYLDADDDEAVLAAFMARATGPGATTGAAADGAAS